MHYEFMIPVGYARKFTSGSPLLTPLPLMNNDKIHQCVRACLRTCMCILCVSVHRFVLTVCTCVFLFSMVWQTFCLLIAITSCTSCCRHVHIMILLIPVLQMYIHAFMLYSVSWLPFYLQKFVNLFICKICAIS